MRAGAEVHEVKATRKALGVGLVLSILVTLLLAVSAPLLMANGFAAGVVVASIVLAIAGGLLVAVLADQLLTPAAVRADDLELAA